LLGEIETRADNIGAVEDHYRKAMVLASELGMMPLLAHCHFGLGKAQVSASKGQQREHLVAAANLYRTLDMQIWLHGAEITLRQLPRPSS
jgi:hypothetical protein